MQSVWVWHGVYYRYVRHSAWIFFYFIFRLFSCLLWCFLFRNDVAPTLQQNRSNRSISIDRNRRTSFLDRLKNASCKCDCHSGGKIASTNRYQSILQFVVQKAWVWNHMNMLADGSEIDKNLRVISINRSINIDLHHRLHQESTAWCGIYTNFSDEFCTLLSGTDSSAKIDLSVLTFLESIDFDWLIITVYLLLSLTTAFYSFAWLILIYLFIY